MRDSYIILTNKDETIIIYYKTLSLVAALNKLFSNCCQSENFSIQSLIFIYIFFSISEMKG